MVLCACFVAVGKLDGDVANDSFKSGLVHADLLSLIAVLLSVCDLVGNTGSEFYQHLGKMGGFDVIEVVAGDGVYLLNHFGNVGNFLLECVGGSVPIGGGLVGMDVVCHGAFSFRCVGGGVPWFLAII